MAVTAPAGALLAKFQAELESIYGVRGPVPVEGYVIDRQRWQQLSASQAPEELVVVDHGDDLEIGLYLEDGLMEQLTGGGGWTHARLSAHCTVVEGVSHFLYLTHRAMVPRSVNHLELELQAEVDKFVTVLLRLWRRGLQAASATLRERLFDRVSFRPGLAPQMRERYETANFLARLYCRYLEARYVVENRWEGLLTELRRWYRLGGGEKLSMAASGSPF